MIYSSIKTQKTMSKLLDQDQLAVHSHINGKMIKYCL